MHKGNATCLTGDFVTLFKRKEYEKHTHFIIAHGSTKSAKTFDLIGQYSFLFSHQSVKNLSKIEMWCGKLFVDSVSYLEMKIENESCNFDLSCIVNDKRGVLIRPWFWNCERHNFFPQIALTDQIELKVIWKELHKPSFVQINWDGYFFGNKQERYNFHTHKKIIIVRQPIIKSSVFFKEIDATIWSPSNHNLFGPEFNMRSKMLFMIIKRFKVNLDKHMRFLLISMLALAEGQMIQSFQIDMTVWQGQTKMLFVATIDHHGKIIKKKDGALIEMFLDDSNQHCIPGRSTE